jgi:hypothetical protein
MNKDLSPYFEEKFSLSRFQDKRWLSSAAAFIAGAAVLIFYFHSAPKTEAYVYAEEAVSKWESSPDETSYLEMKKALKKVPALEKKYEAAIAQKLFEKERLSEALSMAHSSLKRIETEAPFHAAFGETSLLIEQGAFQDALEKSVGLKERMIRSQDWNQSSGENLLGGALIFAHNLLRIACLQQELNNKPGEKAAWDEFESFLKEKQSLSQLVLGSFREKGVDLTSYIAERRKWL